MTTAETIKRIRKELLLTQAQLAHALSLTVSTISYYEIGRRQPSYATVRKILALAKKNKIKLSIDDIRPE